MRAGSAPIPSLDPIPALAARLGASAVADLEAREALAIGGVVPSLVARPGDPAELAAMVADVDAVGGALVPLGRGAHRGIGHPPRRYDLALTTARLARVCDYTPADMTVTVEAGVTLADLAGVLAGEGQWLPIEPALPATTTVGGLLAADLAGPFAASQGRVRDFVIGIAVVTAAGTPARAGGRVVKNVAGYDLMKLFIGSLGTLAVVTEATFKVRPRPEERRCLVFACREVAAAVDFGAALGVTRSGALAATVVVESGEGDHLSSIVVRLAGVAADVAVARARLLDLAAARAAELIIDADDGDPAPAPYLERVRDFPNDAAGDLALRFAVLPSGAPGLVTSVLAACAAGRVSCHFDPLRGIVTLALTAAAPERTLETLWRVAQAHDARLVVERWPVGLASTIEVWRPLPAGLPLMRRMKEALDPHGTLAPGRFVGRL